jgi:hypothetical protein
MATHLIRRYPTFSTSPPVVDIERCFLYIRPQPPYTVDIPASGRLHGACAPCYTLLRVFVDETIQEMSERIKREVGTARQRLVREELTRQKSNCRVRVVN